MGSDKDRRKVATCPRPTNNEEGTRNLRNQPVEFISSTGHKVIIENNPSPQACEQFVRVCLGIKAKYGI